MAPPPTAPPPPPPPSARRRLRPRRRFSKPALAAAAAAAATFFSSDGVAVVAFSSSPSSSSSWVARAPPSTSSSRRSIPRSPSSAAVHINAFCLESAVSPRIASPLRPRWRRQQSSPPGTRCGLKDEKQGFGEEAQEEESPSTTLLDSIRDALGWFDGSEEDDDDRSFSATMTEAATKAEEEASNEESGVALPSFLPRISFLSSQETTTEEESERKRQSLQEDIRTKRRDLSSDGFGPLLPVAEAVDELTGGWGLSYADLSPETPQTPLGRAFLATNAFYALAGLALSVKGELVLGGLTELAGAVSFWYHYSQLQFGQDRSEVRLALLTDYATAGSALITGGIYLINLGVTEIPLNVLVWSGLSVVCLSLSWVWEFGVPYLWWHSLWHILSAYAGYLIGRAHLGEDGALEWTTTATTTTLTLLPLPPEEVGEQASRLSASLLSAFASLDAAGLHHFPAP